MFKKILSTFFVKVLMGITNLLVAVIVSQYLGAEGRGEISLIVISISVILNFTYIFGGGSLVFLVPRHNTYQLWITSNLWSVIISLLGFLILHGLQLFSLTISFHIAAISFLNALFYINTTILIGKEKVHLNNVLRFSQSFLNLVILLLLFFFFNKMSALSYIISLYIAFGATFLLSLYFIKEYLVYESWKPLSSIINIGKVGILNQTGDILQFLTLRINFYILAKYSGESALGVYSNAAAIVEAVLLITTSITVIQYSKIANSNDKAYSTQLTVDLIRYSNLICILILIPLFFLPPELFTFIFGKDFYSVPFAVKALIPGIFFYNIALIIMHYFEGRGMYKIKAICSLTSLISILIISFLIVPNYGLVEAGLSSSFAYLILLLSLLLYFSKEIKVGLLDFIPTKKELIASHASIKDFLKKS